MKKYLILFCLLLIFSCASEPDPIEYEYHEYYGVIIDINFTGGYYGKYVVTTDKLKLIKYSSAFEGELITGRYLYRGKKFQGKYEYSEYLFIRREKIQ